MTEEQISKTIDFIENTWIERTEKKEMRIDEINPGTRVLMSEVRTFIKENEGLSGTDLFCKEFEFALMKMWRRLKRKHPNENW